MIFDAQVTATARNKPELQLDPRHPHRSSPDPKRDEKDAAKTVERLMGRKPELRFAFIQERARFVGSDELDV